MILLSNKGLSSPRVLFSPNISGQQCILIVLDPNKIPILSFNNKKSGENAGNYMRT